MDMFKLSFGLRVITNTKTVQFCAHQRLKSEKNPFHFHSNVTDFVPSNETQSKYRKYQKKTQSSDSDFVSFIKWYNSSGLNIIMILQRNAYNKDN